jgi:hypothetical protein
MVFGHLDIQVAERLARIELNLAMTNRLAKVSRRSCHLKFAIVACDQDHWLVLLA